MDKEDSVNEDQNLAVETIESPGPALAGCPFCLDGGDPWVPSQGEPVHCSMCGADGPRPKGAAAKVEAWNARASQLATDERDARIAELERRLKIPFSKLPCAQCGGPHDFDTSVPSELWNRVIRAKGLPEYLCTTCIVREFVRAGENFTAELWNEEFYGVKIAVITQPATSGAE